MRIEFHLLDFLCNLIYTGITRTKKLLVMVGIEKALVYAVRNVTVTSKNTKLCERLGGAERNHEMDALFNKLAKSEFRSRFALDEKEREDSR